MHPPAIEPPEFRAARQRTPKEAHGVFTASLNRALRDMAAALAEASTRFAVRQTSRTGGK